MVDRVSVEELKREADAWIGDHASEISEWHNTIWNYAEPAWREYKSSAWFVARLRAEGFTVEEGSAGMPTAFSARWSNGPGPTLLAYAEYDAVPGNCQSASTQRGPREGLSRFAPGHTDPHSALGISSLAAVLAAKTVMIENEVGGTLVYTGEPAEKVCGSKVVHGVHGYYDDVDAIISFHPFYMLPLCNTVRWDTHCGAYFSKIYSFVCDSPETWGALDNSPIAAAHSAARAPGADAALTTMWSLTKTSQDSMAAATGGWSLSEAILTAGQATADNLPAGLAQIEYSWRTPDLATAERIGRVLDSNARLAASSAHCEVEERWVSRNRPGIANHEMAEVTWQNMQRVGPPVWGEDARAVANALREELGVPGVERPFLPETESLIDPRDAESQLRALLPPWQTNWTSDDYVEMTWYAPTVRLYVARPALSREGFEAAIPAWVMNALGGIASTIDPTIQCAARVIAGTLLDLFSDPTRLVRAKSEWRERRSSGPMEPLLPKDFTAPIDFRWPEYVTTERGHDWWIPPSTEF
ncbi:MAG: amidohydrolase [Acidimicrobiaceae bacterium]|nr:amidohydrolase [Acidimicrobiaceae bacterium]